MGDKEVLDLSTGQIYVNDEPLITPIPTLNILTEAFSDVLNDFLQAIRVSARVLRDFMLSMCPNGKIVHLAKHSKKARIRKKNLKRAVKILRNLGEN